MIAKRDAYSRISHKLKRSPFSSNVTALAKERGIDFTLAEVWFGERWFRELMDQLATLQAQPRRCGLPLTPSPGILEASSSRSENATHPA